RTSAKHRTMDSSPPSRSPILQIPAKHRRAIPPVPATGQGRHHSHTHIPMPTPTCRCPQSRSASRMTWTTRPSMAATGATGKRHGPTPDDKQHLKNNTAMVILIGNQKGGAGKSTLTLLLANYLTAAQQRKVTVLDMDYQQSVSAKYEKARVLE